MHNDLWSYVDGMAVKDSTDTKLQEYYDTKSRVTLALINLSVGGNIIENVQDEKTPKEAWDTITNMYETKNDARALMLREQLYGLKLDDGSVIDHVQQIEQIKNQLHTIRELLTEKELVASTMKNLHKAYESFKTSLAIFTKMKTLTFNELEALLLQQEQSLKELEEGESSGAYVAKYKGKKHVV